MRRNISATFIDCALESFAFLTTEGYGTQEVDRQHHSITFRCPDHSIEIGYDPREDYVASIVSAKVGDRNPIASVSCLYVAASLGAAQDIKSKVLTHHSLAAALESHASAIRKLLPALKSEDRDRLLLECHGR